MMEMFLPGPRPPLYLVSVNPPIAQGGAGSPAQPWEGFTTEHAADVGFFTIDICRPHTIVLNPIVGGVTLAAGIVLTIVGLRSASA